MLKTKETEEIRRIKRWYDQITQGLRPTKAELESQFRGYVDQAALLIQRIDEGQPWEDFKLGIEGAPAGLLRRLSKMDFERSFEHPPQDTFSKFLFVLNGTDIRPKQVPIKILANFLKLIERRTFMRQGLASVIAAAVLFALPVSCMAASANFQGKKEKPQNVQVGPRPYYLVEDMDAGPLKRTLQQCSEKPLLKTDFSIGHRGAALQFPEHTKESYTAAARMGAGIVECDVTFTQDKQLVCRHAQNDLHTTTNILETPLASKCTKGFTPAEFNPDGSLKTAASAECRTSDITLPEFKTLKGKMDAFNPRATTVAEFMGGTPNFRTDLYAYNGTLLTHAESIELFKDLGVKMTPELKSPSVPMPFNGFTQEQYAQKMIDEYKAAGVLPEDVWPQSFDLRDVLYWIKNEPAFGKQAVYLDDAEVSAELPSAEELLSYRAQGVNIVAPPIWALIALQGRKIVPSKYTENAKAAGLDIITWTLERSGLLTDGGGFYYQTVSDVINKPGDTMEVLDVLARQVGILGIFSDWPGTVTYYANCMGLK